MRVNFSCLGCFLQFPKTGPIFLKTQKELLIIDMEKNTVQTSLLIKNPDITITCVASFRSFIFVSVYGGKLYIYTIRKGSSLKIC